VIDRFAASKTWSWKTPLPAVVGVPESDAVVMPSWENKSPPGTPAGAMV
jgi:hypothetical protein